MGEDRMEQLRKMLAAGVSLPTAIKECLSPMSVAEFAEKHSRPASQISNVINGNWKPNDADVAALVAQFGGSPAEWRLLLWEHSRPAVAS